MQLDKHILGFDLLLIGMCILSQVLLIVLCCSKPRRTMASGQTVQGDEQRLGEVAYWALIAFFGVTLLLLLRAIVDFSNHVGYFFILLLGFLVCGTGISFAFRVMLNLRWERPWLDVCKLIMSVGLLGLFAWGIKYLVLALLFFGVLWVYGPWVQLAK